MDTWPSPGMTVPGPSCVLSSNIAFSTDIAEKCSEITGVGGDIAPHPHQALSRRQIGGCDGSFFDHGDG